jgi:hypothetical protein
VLFMGVGLAWLIGYFEPPHAQVPPRRPAATSSPNLP